MVAERSVS